MIADSEALANEILAQRLTSLGLPTTRDESLACYMGRRWPEVMALAEQKLGRPLPEDFSEQTHLATLAHFRNDLREVSGASAFLRRHGHLPRCIASSSSMERLTLCLALLGLEKEFAGRVFSADLVTRGKPHPDIFLYAATEIGAPPEACLVIEDSPSGVMAGKAAGMTVIGLCAGAHIRDGHAHHLRDAGADHIAHDWKDVAALISAA